jgi:hypothetical protein
MEGVPPDSANMRRMKLWLLRLLLILCLAPLALGTDINISIYNYTGSRVVMYLNYQWYAVLDPQEYRGITVPWNEWVYLDFYRYPNGSINSAYHEQLSLGKYHPTENIYLYENLLP